jgi:Transposase and inactivated derivatives
MTAVGIDTHKASLAACAVDALGAPLAERTFANDPAGHAALATWIEDVAPGAVIGIEGSASYGAALARTLLAGGAIVREVPPQLSNRERGRTRRPGKSDPTDALAIARVTVREPELPPVRLADRTVEIRLLVQAREDAVSEAIRVRNRLHADLVVLVPGYGAVIPNLLAARHRQRAAAMLRQRSGVQVDLARTRLARLHVLDREARALEARIGELVGAHPLLEMHGVGLLTAAKIIAEAGDVRRFHSVDAFAMLAGVAPVPASSGQVQRMRLNRGGNRQLNRAFYTIAMVQAVRYPPAQAFLARKATEHKSAREGIRALKRQLVRPVFRLLLDGAAALSQAA